MVHFAVIVETKLWVNTYMAQPTRQPWSSGGTETPARENWAGRRPRDSAAPVWAGAGNSRSPGRAPPWPARGGRRWARTAARAQTRVAGARPKEEPGPTAVGGEKSCVWVQEPHLWGSALALGCGTQKTVGILEFWGCPRVRSHVDLGRAQDMGKGVGGSSEAPWGPDREVLRAPFGHSRAPRTPLHFPRLGCGAGGPRLRARAGMENALRCPADSPSWLFCPQRVPSSRCPEGYQARMRTDEGSVTPREAGSCPAAAARLFIQCAGRGVGFPSLGASNAGLAQGTRLPSFFY